MTADTTGRVGVATRVTSAGQLLEDCDDCGGDRVSLAEFEDTPIMNATLERHDEWVARMRRVDGYPDALGRALKALFVACELSNERRKFHATLARATEALHYLNGSAPGFLYGPSIGIEGFFEAAARDLVALKLAGVSDDDPQVSALLADLAEAGR